jgi:hypothetical protein
MIWIGDISEFEFKTKQTHFIWRSGAVSKSDLQHFLFQLTKHLSKRIENKIKIEIK